MTGILFTKEEDPNKPKGSDDLKGAIPKGFEKFFKKKDGSDKPAGSSP